MFSTITYVVGTKMYRLNETIFLCTININPWLQKDFHVYNFLHEFQKSNDTNLKLISLKRKPEISIYTFNVFNNIYLVSTQKCRLNETVLLSTQDIKPWL